MNNDDLAQRDLAAVWHPCTQMHDHQSLPMIPIRRGQGVWLEDFDGRRYLDAISSWWVNLFGHAHPYIVERITQQLSELEHVILAGFTHQPAIELAEALLRLSPSGLSRCFYAENGSAAVEIALKMSFHYWRNLGHGNKTEFVSLANSYHGETLGALAVGDVALYKDTYGQLLMRSHTASSPDYFCREPGESEMDYALRRANDLEQILEHKSSQLCAVIVEPLVQCAGNMRMYHPAYLTRVRELCDRYQVHLIADECAVGFGRTGTMFACEQARITPDFMCLAKGLTGGFLPLSSVLTRESIYQAFYAEYETLRGFLHSHSYTGNPLACTAALASLELFKRENTLQHNQWLAQVMAQTADTLRDHPHVGDVRQTGMILAIEMVKQKNSKTPYPWQERRGLQVYQYGLKNEMLLRPLGNVVYWMPPYVIDEEQIALMGKVTREGIDIATRD